MHDLIFSGQITALKSEYVETDRLVYIPRETLFRLKNTLILVRNPHNLASNNAHLGLPDEFQN